MDYTLRRQPDGTVNAQPGDAVEYRLNDKWQPATFGSVYMANTVTLIRDNQILCVDIPDVRHARGGAGWHRLREARLRAAAERIQRDDLLNPDFYKQWLAEALADLDNAEPEA